MIFSSSQSLQIV